MEKSTLILFAGIGGAIVLALVYSQNKAAPEPVVAHAATVNDVPQEDPQADTEQQQANMVAPVAEPAALTWKAPATWTSMPNPNTMRVETRKIPRAASDKEDGELSVARAGGDVAGNIARWTGQFEGAFTLKQSNKTVHEMKVTRVEIEGVYAGGMSATAGEGKAGWVMLAAIVESKGQPYFFKVVGPAATVHAAEKSFDAMIDGLTPS